MVSASKIAATAGALLGSLTLAAAHTVEICSGVVDGELIFYAGTYHYASEPPSAVIGGVVIDGTRFDFTSYVGDAGQEPAGVDLSSLSCTACPTYTSSSIKYWQNVNVPVTDAVIQNAIANNDGDVLVTTTSDTDKEAPWPSCFPLTLNIKASVEAACSAATTWTDYKAGATKLAITDGDTVASSSSKHKWFNVVSQGSTYADENGLRWLVACEEGSFKGKCMAGVTQEPIAEAHNDLNAARTNNVYGADSKANMYMDGDYTTGGGSGEHTARQFIEIVHCPNSKTITVTTYQADYTIADTATRFTSATPKETRVFTEADGVNENPYNLVASVRKNDAATVLDTSARIHVAECFDCSSPGRALRGM